MDLKQTETTETAVNPEEELKKLREKTDKDEMTELKRGLLGGYRSRDVAQFVSRLKEQLQTSEKTFKNHITELGAEKDQLRIERDALLAKVALYESSENQKSEAEFAFSKDDASKRELHASILKSELQQAKRTAEGFLADKDSLESKLRDLSQLADENIAELQGRLDILDAELKQATEISSTLSAEKETFQAQLEAQAGEANARAAALEQQIDSLSEKLQLTQQQRDGLQVHKDALQGELAARAKEYEESTSSLSQQMIQLEEQLVAGESQAADFEAKLDDTLKKLDRKVEENLQLRSQLSETRQENCRLNVQVDNLTCENNGLATQLEVARQNILKLLSDKEAIEDINGQLRDALNNLLVKADAIIRENTVVASQLDTERDKVQQLQAMHEKLCDMLMRVRMANQLLDERIIDMDKALAWGSGQMVKPNTIAKHRNTKSEMLDFTDGKSTALKDIISELNSIQNNLAQYQQPLLHWDEPDKKPNARHSMEKVDSESSVEKSENTCDSIDEFRLPDNGELGSMVG
jgi:chromosome segregation ATPase